MYISLDDSIIMDARCIKQVCPVLPGGRGCCYFENLTPKP